MFFFVDAMEAILVQCFFLFFVCWGGFPQARYCQGYSVKEYVIKLTAVVNNSSTSIGPYFPSNANYTAIIVQLQPNVKYIYIITAASAVGNSSSSGHILCKKC